MKSKEQKRIEAEVRRAEREARGDVGQLELINRLHPNGAKRERARLEARIATVVEPKKSKKQKKEK